MTKWILLLALALGGCDNYCNHKKEKQYQFFLGMQAGFREGQDMTSRQVDEEIRYLEEYLKEIK